MFFGVLAQSSLGTGAAHVALLLIAYERLHSPWAISLVLMADLVPAMLLGPLFGAMADRWSQRRCLVVADVIRAVAFGGIAFVDGFAATLLLALVAGVGTGLFTPAALAALPGLAAPRHLSASTSLYGAIADLGFTAGPGAAAVLLVFAGPEAIMAVNGATFLVSAVVLVGMRFGAAPAGFAGPRPSLLSEAREGLSALAHVRGTRTVVVASAAVLFFGGLFNVAELPFARGYLDAGPVGFSFLVAAFGAGVVAGSLIGARGGTTEELRRNFLAGLLVAGVGLVACGLAFSLTTGLIAFAATGFGNGLVLVHERLLIQRTLPGRMLGRVFGAKDALTAWAFALAFGAAGALVSVAGARAVILAAGAGGLLVWWVAFVGLRRSRRSAEPVGLPDERAVASG